jgi:ethanolamine utilization protein EutQ (cupin superfamily)
MANYNVFKKGQYEIPPLEFDGQAPKDTYYAELGKDSRENMRFGIFKMKNNSIDGGIYPFDEVIIILKGSVNIKINGNVESLKEGDVIEIKKDSHPILETEEFVELFFVSYYV